MRTKILSAIVIAFLALSIFTSIASAQSQAKEIKSYKDGDRVIFEDEDEGIRIVLTTKQYSNRFTFALGRLLNSFYAITLDRQSWTIGEIVTGQDQFGIDSCSTDVRYDWSITGTGANGLYSTFGQVNLGPRSYTNELRTISINTNNRLAGNYKYQSWWRCKKTVAGIPSYPLMTPLFGESNPDSEIYTLTTSPVCTPNWQCSSWENWGQCNSAGTQNRYRTCTDVSCGYTTGSPETYETRSCGTGTPPPQTCGNGVTEGTEQCDTGTARGSCPATCSSSCTTNSCGTGTPPPTVNDPPIPITILSLTYGYPNGDDITGQVRPGTEVKINFKIKADNSDSFFSLGRDYLLEAGILPKQTAESWFPNTNAQTGFGQSYSIFSIIETSRNVCCKGQPNIASVRVNAGGIIQPDEALKWLLFRDDVSTATYKGSVVVKVPDPTTTDVCPVNPGGEIYWNGTDHVYAVYFLVANDCHFEEGIDTGYSNQKWLIKEISVDIGADTSKLGSSCNDDFDCGIGEICENREGLFKVGKECKGTLTGSAGITSKQKGIKISDIDSATTPELFQSVCTEDIQCEEGSKCTSLNKLVEDNKISDIQASEIANTIKNKITADFVVGATTSVICAKYLSPLLTVGPQSIPIIITACTGAGIVSGIGVDKLISALREGDLSKTGLCTIESNPLTDFIEKAAFFKITGDSTTDGLIIIIGGLFIVVILFRLGGGR